MIPAPRRMLEVVSDVLTEHERSIGDFAMRKELAKCRLVLAVVGRTFDTYIPTVLSVIDEYDALFADGGRNRRAPLDSEYESLDRALDDRRRIACMYLKDPAGQLPTDRILELLRRDLEGEIQLEPTW